MCDRDEVFDILRIFFAAHKREQGTFQLRRPVYVEHFRWLDLEEWKQAAWHFQCLIHRNDALPLCAVPDACIGFGKADSCCRMSSYCVG